MTSARHHAIEYIDVETDPARREEIFAKLTREIDVIKGLPEKYRARIRQEEKLVALFRAAYEAREAQERAASDPGIDRMAAGATPTER